MALKITTENTVKTLRPQNGKTFTIDELNEHVGGWIEPFKVGPVWVVCLEKSKEQKKKTHGKKEVKVWK